MNIFNIENTFKLKAERKWDTVYVVVDFHGTMIKPFHDKFVFYSGAVEVLRWFTWRKDVKLILWTSSHMKEIADFCFFADQQGIRFDFVNGNPSEANTVRANFDKKFYFNILLDDKAGFDPETDWGKVRDTLITIGEWNK